MLSCCWKREEETLTMSAWRGPRLPRARCEVANNCDQYQKKETNSTALPLLRLPQPQRREEYSPHLPLHYPHFLRQRTARTLSRPSSHSLIIFGLIGVYIPTMAAEKQQDDHGLVETTLKFLWPMGRTAAREQTTDRRKYLFFVRRIRTKVAYLIYNETCYPVNYISALFYTRHSWNGLRRRIFWHLQSTSRGEAIWLHMINTPLSRFTVLHNGTHKDHQSAALCNI